MFIQLIHIPDRIVGKGEMNAVQMVCPEQLITKEQVKSKHTVSRFDPCRIHTRIKAEIRKRVLTCFLTVELRKRRRCKAVFFTALMSSIVAHQDFGIQPCKAVLIHDIFRAAFRQGCIFKISKRLRLNKPDIRKINPFFRKDIA